MISELLAAASAMLPLSSGLLSLTAAVASTWVFMHAKEELIKHSDIEDPKEFDRLSDKQKLELLENLSNEEKSKLLEKFNQERNDSTKGIKHT